jgi:tRNA(Ile)-lysidine synthase
MSPRTRSHPPTLLTLARRALEGECGPVRGEHVLVALSGGRDSMALVHVLARLRERLGFELTAHGVDHGLRAGAEAELARARGFCEGLGVRFESSQVHVAAGGNLPARARDARYAALARAMDRSGATLLATAHHAADRAETVLLRMMRGASTSGLAVLPPRAGERVRPLIRASRAAIDAHVRRHAVPFSDDPSNDDPRFLRTRVRHELMPLLEELSPGIVEHLCALADDLARPPPRPRTRPHEPEPEPEPGRGRGRGPERELEPEAETGPGRELEAEPEAASADAPLPWLTGRSRAVRRALDALVIEQSPRARVALPGSRDARYDRVLGRVVVEPRAERARTHSDASATAAAAKKRRERSS